MRVSSASLVTVGVLVVLASGPLPAQFSPADCLVGPVRLTVDPPEPRFAGARPTITVAGTWCQGTGPQLSSFGVDGKLLELRTVASSAGVAATVPFSISLQTPPLELGDYTVELSIDDEAVAGGFEVVFRGGFRVSDLHECSEAGCPGATLLFPYFEVDPADPLGRTTMISLANADDEPALTRLVVWSNWGIPLLGLDVALPAEGLRSLHLGALLGSGALPTPAEPPAGLPGCPSPPPDLAAAALAALRARLLGEPDPEDGLCYAGATPAGLITGYITVDVVDRCSSTARYPGDPGYFEDVEGGVAGDRNVLSGDWFLIDGPSHQARAFRAVAVRSHGSVQPMDGIYLPHSFYGNGLDHRQPLPIFHQARILAGPPFATDLIIWSEGRVGERFPQIEPRDCAEQPASIWIGFSALAETPVPTGGELVWEELTTPLRTQRIDVRALPGDTVPGFGTLRLCTKSRSAFGLLSPPPTLFQGWVGVVFAFGGGFGASEAATPLASHGCL